MKLMSFPQPAQESDYVVAANELEHRLAELPGAIAVYRFGSVTAPGISDIDRLVVVDGAAEIESVWPSLSPETRRLAMHAPFLADRRTFVKHRWFADLGRLELVSGEGLEVVGRPVPEESESLLAAEALVVSLLKLRKQAVTGRIKVRPVLCELNTVRADLELAGVTREACPEAWQLADDVAKLRCSWWTLSDSERRAGVIDVVVGATASVVHALYALAEHLPDRRGKPVLRLRAEWSNVSLVPGQASHVNGTGSVSLLTRHSRRLGEAVWRAVPRRVAIPEAVLAHVAGVSDQYRAFRSERVQLVRRYSELLAAARDYSAIGVARVFVS